MNIGAAIALYVSVSIGLFVTFFLCCLSVMLSGEQWQEKARARRMAEHRMNARLLRLNL
jgi:hypothetical protein